MSRAHTIWQPQRLTILLGGIVLSTSKIPGAEPFERTTYKVVTTRHILSIRRNGIRIFTHFCLVDLMINVTHADEDDRISKVSTLEFWPQLVVGSFSLLYLVRQFLFKKHSTLRSVCLLQFWLLQMNVLSLIFFQSMTCRRELNTLSIKSCSVLWPLLLDLDQRQTLKQLSPVGKEFWWVSKLSRVFQYHANLKQEENSPQSAPSKSIIH